ncbi:MAG: hypothetical protein G01um101470_750, partial [Parcubacteria group bacterium Gr01-1014_70]
SIDFLFYSGKLLYVKIMEGRRLCAKVEWSGILAGATFSDDCLHLYQQNGDGYIKIHLDKGVIFAK